MPRCSELHHIFKLTHVQIVVEAFLRKQLRCIALLDDAAVVDDEDPVGLLDRGKAVCNDKGVDVVLPPPPFWLATAIRRVRLGLGKSVFLSTS